MVNISEWIIEKVGLWLLKEAPPKRGYLCDFDHICKELKRGDVLLIEGRSRASSIIKQVTQSPWSHATLYIGRIDDIKDPTYKRIVERQSKYTPETQLLIESEIGLGTIIAAVDKYRYDHIRILRPHGIIPESIPKVIQYAISRIGRSYDIRHILDLLRFMFPWGLFPRHWRSSLFQHNALQPTRDICSTMIANAFHSVNFPIVPMIRRNDAKEIELIERNPNLFTPSDFDYSPFFDVIKYPILPTDAQGEYKNLNWRIEINDIGDHYLE